MKARTAPTVTVIIAVAISIVCASRDTDARGKPPVPDLTRGGTKDASHDWNLGPTGARGWIWGWKLETTDARQILITRVDEGSPSDGVLEVGDVILGVDGAPFSSDARKAFGRAVTVAETRECGGALRMLRWRAGKTESVELRLAVTGSYGESSPFDLTNDDGRARGCVASVYRNLSYDELRPLLPAIHRAIVEPAPSGVMFASGIRLRGLELFAKHRIREGMALCIDIMDIERWGKRARIKSCLKILGSYGAAAKPMIPRLRELEERLRRHREGRNLKPEIELAREAIATIEAAKDDGRPLRSLRSR